MSLLAARVVDGSQVDQLVSETPILPHCWYFVAASFQASSGKATLRVINCVTSWNSRISTVVPIDLDTWLEETLRTKPGRTKDTVRFMLAGASESNQKRGPHTALLYNGKIDRCGIYQRVISSDSCQVPVNVTSKRPRRLRPRMASLSLGESLIESERPVARPYFTAL